LRAIVPLERTLGDSLASELFALWTAKVDAFVQSQDRFLMQLFG
jgi:hypothetical protein